MSEDTSSFAYGHAEAAAIADGPSSRFQARPSGRSSTSTSTSPSATLACEGLRGQFRFPDGGVITVPFTVEAA
jgi:hypothetical protein